jgi:Domain of unknown function (DUF4105)
LKKTFFLLIVSLAFSGFLHAQRTLSTVPWADGRSKAADLQISLVTFSPGDVLTDWWGHTALVVKDSRYKIARVYNFGFYSFDDGFVGNFAMGRLIFWAGDVSLNATLNHYVKAKRTISIQNLNIPENMRLNIAAELARAVQPENSRYLYDHYKENCATRLRDFINDGVNGQFADSMKVAGRLTFRQHTLRYTAHAPLMQWLLMFLMNDTIDKPIQKWDEMFLPDELAKYVAKLSYRDSTGNRHKLVAKQFTYYDAHRTPVPFTATNTPIWAVIAGLFLGILATGLGIWASKGKKLARVLFLIYNSLAGLIFGLMGTVLFFMSLFTDHFVTYGNENLFLANPLTFIVFFLSVVLLFKNSKKNWGYLKIVWMVLAASSIILLLLKILPVFDQDNIMIFFILLPVNIGFAMGHYFITRTK